MSEQNQKLDETEQIFSEFYAVLEKANQVKANHNMPSQALMIAYMQLAESFENLLKTSVRIARLGDKAQKKLMKYKELMDTLRSMD